MELHKGYACVHAASISEWRDWLTNNHESSTAIWLIIYRKQAQTPSISYPEAVDEALCFGWIDGKPNKRDAISYYQFFSPRNPKSNWSQVNKDKVARLLAEGRMHESGLKLAELAKQTGTWSALDKVSALQEPKELEEALQQFPKAKGNWNNFPPSVRRGILEWILSAKTTETRIKRIRETVTKAEQNIRANQYTKKP